MTFPFGEAEVFHMISHYYLQRAETQTQRHASNWTTYAAEKGMAEVAAAAPADLADLSVAEVEAAHSSLRMMTQRDRSQAAEHPRKERLVPACVRRGRRAEGRIPLPHPRTMFNVAARVSRSFRVSRHWGDAKHVWQDLGTFKQRWQRKPGIEKGCETAS